MDDKSRFSVMMDSLSEWLNEQDWFQQLKSKWEELDPQSRLYLQIAGSAGTGILLVVVLFNFFWSVHNLRQEVNDKAELLTLINSANEELHSLQTTAAGLGSASVTPEPWPTYFETTAASAGITKGLLNISDTKVGSTSDLAKENLFDVTMKKVNIRQAVRFAQALENGQRPVKLRNLTIDTQPDGSGYLDVTLAVSAFALNAK